MFNQSLAKQLKSHYQSNYPYPYMVIDNFFDESILETALDELKNFKYWGYDPTQTVMEVNKFMTPWDQSNLPELERDCPIARYVLKYLNSEKSLSFLQELTGIDDLIPDNLFMGGGVHKITNGGKLAVHADYSYHRITQYHRRVNLLLYLNKDWKPEYGGNLELWEPDMSKKVADIEPIFNRAVIFNITNKALHGHPIPLNTPPDVARYSFALYYFTKDRPQEEIEANQREGDQSSVMWIETPEETIIREKNNSGPFKF